MYEIDSFLSSFVLVFTNGTTFPLKNIFSETCTSRGKKLYFTFDRSYYSMCDAILTYYKYMFWLFANWLISAPLLSKHGEKKLAEDWETLF